MTLAAPPAVGVPVLDSPPSLRRRGPALLDFLDPAGESPPLTPGGFHLRSARQYTLRVRPQPPDDDGHVAQVAAEPGEAVQTLIPLTAAATPAGPEYTAAFSPLLRRPIPARTDIVVTLAHDAWGPLSVRVPVVVWPSFRTQLLWVLTTVLAVLGARIKALWGEGGAPLLEVAQGVCRDLSFWLEALGLTAAGLILLRVVGWAWLASGGE